MGDKLDARKKPSSRHDPQKSGIVPGFIRIYAVYRATIKPVTAAAITRSLAERGVLVSKSSISHNLSRLTDCGYMQTIQTQTGSARQRQVAYRATRQGRIAITKVRNELREVFNIPP
jgi:DNA-binding PadR family transcriptional regulator